MQCAVVEFARNVLGLESAHSTEIKEYTPHPVIDLMGEQKSITNMGGTMRLGEYPCALKADSQKRNTRMPTFLKSMNVTATATNSTTRTWSNSKHQA